MKDHFLIEMSKLAISMHKRNLRTNYVLLLLNALICLWNIFIIYKSISTMPWATGIAIGVTATSCFWVWASIFETRLDIRLEKEKLAWLEKSNELGNASLLS